MRPKVAHARRSVRPARAPESDQRFRVLVDSIKDYAVFLLDPSGRITTWNAGAQIIKGYKPDEIIGKRIDVFYTSQDLQHGLPDRLLAQAEAVGRVEDEGWRLRKDGTRFWADVVITALRDDVGRLVGFAKVTRDLTERRKIEQERRRRDEELLRAEEKFRLLVEAVEDYAIFMIDPLGYVATWNAGAERIKGYPASEIIGKHFSCFRLPDEVLAGKCEEELATAARHGRIEEEGWRVRKDGSRFWANVVLTAVHGANGELVGFAKVTRDLSERRDLEGERMNRMRAEEAVRLRDEFLSIASHELKTPLTTLQIEIQSMQERSAGYDERTLRRLARAGRSADRLTDLVESLLDVARIANGRLALKPERMDLTETLSHLLDGMAGAAAKAGSHITFEAPGPVHGLWDRLRLEQVVMNLVSNSFKYGAGAPVKVSLSVDGDHAVIDVVDRGPGIPDRDMARIFGRFERAASMRHYGGLGLGLYVSQQIVDAHGGTIQARNGGGGGAHFTVRLPLEARVSAPGPANVVSD